MQDHIHRLLATGFQFHQRGDWSAAEHAYRQILCFIPDHAESLQLLGSMARQVFDVGVSQHQLGEIDSAIECYRRSIRLNPDFDRAYCNLGVALKSQGHLEEAIACYRRAIALNPDSLNSLKNFGNALVAAGNIDEAIVCYRSLIQKWPDLPETYNALGAILCDHGLLEEAESCVRSAVRLKPDFAQAHYNLGVIFSNQGKFDDAIASQQRSIELNPTFAEAHFSLGISFAGRGECERAIGSYRHAVTLKPDFIDAHNNLGLLLLSCEQFSESIACFRRALELSPNFAQVINNLGIAYREMGKLDDAVACFRRAIELNPDYPEVYNNLSMALKDQGQLNDAMACCRRATELKPDYVKAHSNLLYSMTFSPECDPKAIYQEHLHWCQRHAKHLFDQFQTFDNDRSPDRRLRIGYVSPDFRNHPVGRFILPLLQEHDKQQFEIYCYSSVDRPDRMTNLCRAHVSVWRDVKDLSDERLAQQIRGDGIDILVDLTMHMMQNRLLVFARKPAPIQVTYLAYCGTTGLNTIDYRLTDPYLDPSPEVDSIYSEKSVWLPKTYWCYHAEDTLAVMPCPALQTGRITFGCLNNFCKVTENALETWSRLMQEVPESRLILHGREGSHRARIVDFLKHRQVSSDRLTFVDLLPTLQYFACYGQIDIALDSFPYGGGTTTCDSLWMGVPVVTLSGRTAVGRGGTSILSNLDLKELVADNVRQYIDIARDLANDPLQRLHLRNTLRDRMKRSPLTDSRQFARDVEVKYREMWRTWCQENRFRE